MGNNRKDWSGQRFDRVTALEFEDIRGGHTYWKFQCDCGTIISRAIQAVKTNKYNACPDCRTGPGSHAWSGYGEISLDYFNHVCHSAKAKNLKFDLDIEYIWSLFLRQNRKCALTGWDIGFHKKYREKHLKTASLDRIDSSLGYIKGNVQWVHRKVNWIKSNVPDEDFINLCNLVAKTNPRDVSEVRPDDIEILHSIEAGNKKKENQVI